MPLIVLADDDADLRGLYGPCLRSAGYEVLEASSGNEALALVRASRPHLLILDVWMPDGNGFDVLETLKHDASATQLRILMLSNLGDSDTRLECFELGASDYLVKGVSLAEFLQTVSALLDGLESNPG